MLRIAWMKFPGTYTGSPACAPRWASPRPGPSCSPKRSSPSPRPQCWPGIWSFCWTPPTSWRTSTWPIGTPPSSTPCTRCCCRGHRVRQHRWRHGASRAGGDHPDRGVGAAHRRLRSRVADSTIRSRRSMSPAQDGARPGTCGRSIRLLIDAKPGEPPPGRRLRREKREHPRPGSAQSITRYSAGDHTPERRSDSSCLVVAIPVSREPLCR